MRPHGIMFHHFHDHRHPAGQGSLSADDLAAMIRVLGLDRIMPAREWLTNALAGTLDDQDLCLTFDDNLRCQYDVALPVLRDFGLTAFWFLPTAVMQGQLERLELYRAFRVRHFDEIDDFYEAFFRTLATSNYSDPVEQALRDFHPSTYLADHPFYSEADRRFRFVRDQVLGTLRYQQFMDTLIGSMGIELRALAANLWMEPDQVCRLHAEGHVIGLHSHTHPTVLTRLTPRQQLSEYRDNHMYLMSLLGERPVAMSHPCNSYNTDTLAVLERLGIKLGFRANMAQREHSLLELPREDSANVLREMHKCASPSSRATSPAISH
jgi:peptidoglycan/xylan/chitin deacetylase (PgdA/CDA1 family)